LQNSLQESSAVPIGEQMVDCSKDLQRETFEVFLSAAVIHLNESSGRRFTAKSAQTTNLLRFLYEQGYSLDQVKTVIDVKVKQWSNTSVRKYLRPVTLFDYYNFKKYLNESNL